MSHRVPRCKWPMLLLESLLACDMAQLVCTGTLMYWYSHWECAQAAGGGSPPPMTSSWSLSSRLAGSVAGSAQLIGCVCPLLQALTFLRAVGCRRQLLVPKNLCTRTDQVCPVAALACMPAAQPEHGSSNTISLKCGQSIQSSTTRAWNSERELPQGLPGASENTLGWQLYGAAG
jgi:hypothetical protein